LNAKINKNKIKIEPFQPLRLLNMRSTWIPQLVNFFFFVKIPQLIIIKRVLSTFRLKQPAPVIRTRVQPKSARWLLSWTSRNYSAHVINMHLQRWVLRTLIQQVGRNKNNLSSRASVSPKTWHFYLEKLVDPAHTRRRESGWSVLKWDTNMELSMQANNSRCLKWINSRR
jgi:hypothetical protein